MMGTFDREGIQFRYEVLGEGRPLALCHGLGGDRQQPKELAGPLEGYRLIVWDCRGHGETQPVGPAGKFGFGPMVEDLAALLDHLGIERAIVGGISMGAGIAARFAAQWPRRVEALVLVRPAWLVQPLPENLALFPRVADLLRQLGPEAGLAEFKKLPELAAVHRTSPAVAESLCEQFTKPNAAERSARLDRLPRDCPVDRWSIVESLKMPALVVGNEQDTAHPMEFARAWADHLPYGVLSQIPSKSESPTRHAAAFRRCLIQSLNTRESCRSPGRENWDSQ
jgi:pimeloyl-ACP methyl ester carboxylesterase